MQISRNIRRSCGFADIEHLYRIRNAQGRLLEDVAEMLVESNPLLDASSFDRKRQVRKHVRDFTLFFSGLFPERIDRRDRQRTRINQPLAMGVS
jgi:hypothetical protein